ncbi:MFS transporter [Shewanella litorisediminis]|uniref:MFS transporter n=1 Tax=Shewanella litorisediminis TaxID=1173586 RepID=A0ABX7G4Z5_9GAMM|nr:MFS transporter [Shewanella litorisediminis]MCL2917897.1 MFS transporter [Shewanella litorisediminis]QRH02332.1 MFS transporter [Shewanella litorisediminis]
MKATPSIPLMVILMMFPQIVETLYSPALPHIAAGFEVPQAMAGQTLSIYFLAFALGVVCWGILCDHLGRRTALLLGLLLNGIAAFAALWVPSFDWLLTMRALSAFGAAVGSVVTQTMLRDSFDGIALAKVFAYMGIGIAIGPVIGMSVGGLLADLSGYRAVFLTLCLLAVLLFGICLQRLPETRLDGQLPGSIWSLSKRMVKDGHIWHYVTLVAGFNVLLFSYYLQGPFLFQRLGLSMQAFGYSGVVLALGTLIGSAVNKGLLQRGMMPQRLLQLACLLALTGAIGVYFTETHLGFLLPMAIIVAAFGIAIPNLLSQALVDYRDQAGTAGALFGLLYYLLIALGLALVSLTGQLGGSLVITALLLTLATLLGKLRSLIPLGSR